MVDFWFWLEVFEIVVFALVWCAGMILGINLHFGGCKKSANTLFVVAFISFIAFLLNAMLFGVG